METTGCMKKYESQSRKVKQILSFSYNMTFIKHASMPHPLEKRNFSKYKL